MEPYKFDIYANPDQVIYSKVIVAQNYTEASDAFYNEKGKPDGSVVIISNTSIPDKPAPKSTIKIVPARFGYALKVEGLFVKVSPRHAKNRHHEIQLVNLPVRLSHPVPVGATIWANIEDIRYFWTHHRWDVKKALERHQSEQ